MPFTPEIPGFQYFRKPFIHSHYYRDPHQFRGKSVLVLGFRPSGKDISLELTKVCKQVYVSHKGDRCSSKLPDNLTELPKINHINKDGLLVFEHGQVVNVDVLMFCTGYLIDMPFINKKFPETIESGAVKGLYKHIFFIKEPSLCIVGLPWFVLPFPMMDQQCAYIAAIYSGLKKLPSKQEMKLDTEKTEREHSLTGRPPRYIHFLGLEKCVQYFDILASLSGYRKYPPVKVKLALHLFDLIKTGFMGKNTEFRVNDENFEEIKK